MADVTKTELSIATTIIVLLIAGMGWFVTDLIKDTKEQNKAQWAAAARTKECLFEKINHLGERVARIEGYHEAQREKAH